MFWTLLEARSLECPHCRQAALTFLQAAFLDPRYYFLCPLCGSLLDLGRWNKFILVAGVVAVAAALAWTFPRLHSFVNSPENWLGRVALDFVLPPTVIATVTVTVFVPFEWIAWKWGDLALIAPPEQPSA